MAMQPGGVVAVENYASGSSPAPSTLQRLCCLRHAPQHASDCRVAAARGAGGLSQALEAVISGLGWHIAHQSFGRSNTCARPNARLLLTR